MSHDCDFQNVILEMHGKVMSFDNKLDMIHADSKMTKINLNNHIRDSDLYRSKIDILWWVNKFVVVIVISLLGKLIWEVFRGLSSNSNILSILP